MSKQTNMRMTGLAIAGVVLASVLGAAGPSLAQNDDPSAGITVKVHYADLDLRGQAGAKVMFQRIENAAVEACGGQPDVRVLARRMAFDHCRRETIGRAVDALNAPLVTALSGRSSSSVLAGR